MLEVGGERRRLERLFGGAMVDLGKAKKTIGLARAVCFPLRLAVLRNIEYKVMFLFQPREPLCRFCLACGIENDDARTERSHPARKLLREGTRVHVLVDCSEPERRGAT